MWGLDGNGFFRTREPPVQAEVRRDIGDVLTRAREELSALVAVGGDMVDDQEFAVFAGEVTIYV